MKKCIQVRPTPNKSNPQTIMHVKCPARYGILSLIFGLKTGNTANIIETFIEHRRETLNNPT